VLGAISFAASVDTGFFYSKMSTKTKHSGQTSAGKKAITIEPSKDICKKRCQKKDFILPFTNGATLQTVSRETLIEACYMLEDWLLDARKSAALWHKLYNSSLKSMQNLSGVIGVQTQKPASTDRKIIPFSLN